MNIFLEYFSSILPYRVKHGTKNLKHSNKDYTLYINLKNSEY